MLKKLGIAAACAVAIFELAKLLSRDVVVLLDGTAPLFEAITSPDSDELAAHHVTSPGDDLAAGLPLGGVATEDSPNMGAGTSAVQAADPTREP